MTSIEGFASATVEVGGTTLHYVRGGSGPALLLVHGFPQDWYEWRRVMPRLAERYTVVAVDLRGVGGSDAPPTGYSAPELAEDLHGLLTALDLAPAHVVGHDIGGWVAHALAQAHPDDVATLLVMETLLPGVEITTQITVPLWHGEFHMVPDLPEALVAGREAVYFRYFFDVGTVGDDVISDEEVEHYARAYGDPARLHSAFEVYRAIPRNAEAAAAAGPVEVPLLLVGGEAVFGPALVETAGLLRRGGWRDVRAHVVPGGRHYLPEERPDEVAELIEGHAVQAR